MTITAKKTCQYAFFIFDSYSDNLVEDLLKILTQVSTMPIIEEEKGGIKFLYIKDMQSFVATDLFDDDDDDDDVFRYIICNIICRCDSFYAREVENTFKKWIIIQNKYLCKYQKEPEDPFVYLYDSYDQPKDTANLRLNRWNIDNPNPKNVSLVAYEVWLKLNSVIDIIPPLCNALSIEVPQNYEQQAFTFAENYETPYFNLVSKVDHLCYVNIGKLHKEGHINIHISCRRKFNQEVCAVLHEYLVKSYIPEKDISLMMQNWLNNPNEEYKNLQRKYFLENHKPL